MQASLLGCFGCFGCLLCQELNTLQAIEEARKHETLRPPLSQSDHLANSKWVFRWRPRFLHRGSDARCPRPKSPWL